MHLTDIQKANLLIEHIPQWTFEEALGYVKDSKNYSEHIVGSPGQYSVTFMGETILVDGVDITGHLGSNTTYGDNSPIIQGSDNTYQLDNSSTTNTENKVEISNNNEKTNFIEGVGIVVIGGIIVFIISLYIKKLLKKKSSK